MCHNIVSRNSDTFYDDVFAALARVPSPGRNVATVDLDAGGGDGAHGVVALGSSVGALAVALSLAAAFFVLRRRRKRPAEERGAERVLPLQVLDDDDVDDGTGDVGVVTLEEGEGEMSSLDDSLLVDKAPGTASRLRELQVDAVTGRHVERSPDRASGDGGAGSHAPEAAFPRPRDAAPAYAAGVPHSHMTDSDTDASSLQVRLTRDAFVPFDEGSATQGREDREGEKMPATAEADEAPKAPEVTQQGTAMSDNITDNENDAVPADSGLEEHAQPSSEASHGRGLNMFSCFADNTDGASALTAKDIVAKSYRSDATTPNVSNAVHSNAGLMDSVYEYEVRAPPGPLGKNTWIGIRKYDCVSLLTSLCFFLRSKGSSSIPRAEGPSSTRSRTALPSCTWSRRGTSSCPWTASTAAARPRMRWRTGSAPSRGSRNRSWSCGATPKSPSTATPKCRSEVLHRSPPGGDCGYALLIAR